MAHLDFEAQLIVIREVRVHQNVLQIAKQSASKLLWNVHGDGFMRFDVLFVHKLNLSLQRLVLLFKLPNQHSFLLIARHIVAVAVVIP